MGSVGGSHVRHTGASNFLIPGPTKLTETSATAASGGTGLTSGLTSLVMASITSFEVICSPDSHCTATHLSASTSTTTPCLGGSSGSHDPLTSCSAECASPGRKKKEGVDYERALD